MHQKSGLVMHYNVLILVTIDNGAKIPIVSAILQYIKQIILGEKLHLDQNEKLVMFGVTHVAAIDGFSGKIVAFETMPIKNNLILYR